MHDFIDPAAIAYADAHTTPPEGDLAAFVERHPELIGTVRIEGVAQPFELTRTELERIAGKYLLAVQDAGRIYRHVAQAKGEGNFIAEVSISKRTDISKSRLP
jgi:hypothetical protein